VYNKLLSKLGQKVEQSEFDGLAFNQIDQLFNNQSNSFGSSSNQGLHKKKQNNPYKDDQFKQVEEGLR